MMKVDRKDLLVLPRRVKVIMTKGGREQLLVLPARVMVIMMKRVIMTEGVGSNYWSYLLE